MEGFHGESSSRTNLRMHFAHQHPRYSILIPEEGNQSHPRCPQCDMFFPQEAVHWAHPTSSMCRRGSKRKQQRLVSMETEERIGRVFLSYGTLLVAVPSFRSLGRMLLSYNNDWPAVEHNLRQARVKWG